MLFILSCSHAAWIDNKNRGACPQDIRVVKGYFDVIWGDLTVFYFSWNLKRIIKLFSVKTCFWVTRETWFTICIFLTFLWNVKWIFNLFSVKKRDFGLPVIRDLPFLFFSFLVKRDMVIFLLLWNVICKSLYNPETCKLSNSSLFLDSVYTSALKVLRV